MSEVTIPARSANVALPRPIRRVLGRLDRRLRAAALLRGLGTTALVAALGAAPGMGADFASALPQEARWAIWGSWLVVVGVTIVLGVFRPVLKRMAAFDLAAVAERSHPQLGERLTGAVALLGEGRPAHGSPGLIAALADEAAARAGTIEPSRAVAWEKATRRLATGAIAIGLLAAPAVIWPDSYGTLARRFLMPWADLDRVGRFVLTVAPGDRVVAIGADLTVSAGVRPRFGNGPAPEDARLEWTPDGESAAHRVAMPPGSDASRGFAVTLPRLTGSLTYRVVSGPARSRTYRIRAVEPPAISAITARVEPPAYTKMPAAPARDPSRIDAFEGSRVTLDIRASRPVRSIEVEWPDPESGLVGPTSVGPESHSIPKTGPTEVGPTGKRRVAANLSTDLKSGSITVIADASGTYAVTLRDDNDLVNRPESPRRVVVRPDAPPVVAVRGTDGLKESSPDDVLGVGIATRDDVAVASVELHHAIRRAGSDRGEPEVGHVAVILPGLGTRAARGEATLPLRPLGLRPGDTISYRVRVADNRPAPRGPNVVWSSSRELSIVAAAETLQARRAKASREALQAKLDAVKKAAAANRQETEQLRYAADAAQRGNGTWDRARQQALNQREVEARAVADRLQLLARDLADDPQFRPLARPARQISEVEAEAGRATLDQARRDDDPAKRLSDLRQADARLAAVNERLDELQRRFDGLGQREADRQRLRALADKQETLAAHAEGARDRALLDRLQAEQNAVQNDLDALLKKSPELRGEVLDAQANEAESLAKKAHELADRQREEAKQATDLTKHARELKALADAQRALEDDARRLALEVDQPLAENGRGRLNTEEIRQAAEPIERGELDQARQRLEGAEGELRRLTRDLEDVPDDPKALARRLERRQEILNNDIAEATREVRGKNDLNAEEKAALDAKMKPLVARQEAIGRLAKTIRPPEGKESRNRFPRDAAREAAEKIDRAAETLRTLRPREIEGRQNEARHGLQRLANDLPDAWRRQEPARHKLDEARRIANEVAREIERHLRETNPRPDRPSTTARAAGELAKRLHDVADRQARALAALREMEAEPRVDPQRARAVRRAEALAETLKDLRDPSKREQARAALPAVEAEARAAMDRLEQKFNGRVPADDLAAELTEDQRDLDKQPAEGKADDQRRIANALRALNVPDAALAQAEAVRKAEQAARALTEPKQDPHPAVREATEAAQALADRLRAGTAKPAAPAKADRPPDPDLILNEAHTSAAKGLVRRERQIRERLQALLGERVEPQQALREESAALGRALADLRERARPLSDRSQGVAHEAAQHLGEHAPRAMDQGSEHLAQGQPHQARESQRRAAELVERGAQQADDLAAALRADRPAAPRDVAHADPNPLGTAREAMRQAAHQLDQSRDPSQAAESLPAAGQAMRQAAHDLLTAAQPAPSDSPGPGTEPGGDPSLAQSEPGPANPDGPTRDPQSRPGGKADPDLTELQEQIRRKTGRAWGELPGHLRTEILQMSQGRYRDDYARLIQLYFREIAAGASGEKP